MHHSLQLRIVTPSRLLFDDEVREVTAPGAVGEIGVLPDHVTFLTTLDIGAMSFRTDQGVRRLAVRGGFAEVADNVMTVLADDAAFPQDIDVVGARADLQAAEAQLEKLSPVDDAYTSAEANRRWAIARIEAAGAAPELTRTA